VLRALLEHMVKVEASDLYITVGSPPVFRIDGVGYPAKHPLTEEQVATMSMSLLNAAQRAEFNQQLELNVALALDSGDRYRVNMMRQRGAIAMVIRRVRTNIQTLAELRHPAVLAEISWSAAPAAASRRRSPR
jgi:twitching motility protein PilU